jgi:endonuclease I
MKKSILILFISITSNLFGQIPSNYYDSAMGLSGYTLKSELHSIISNGHIDNGYDELYNGYINTDSDNYYENDGSVLDMYSENPSGADPYYYTHNNNTCGTYNSENDCYNREHIVPQSVFNEGSPMKSDIHFVVPTDGYVNNRRSSYAFGEVSNASWTSMNGSKLGSNTYPGYSGTVFEPIDEFKGDIARMLFYFATRYETQIDSWSHTMFNGTEDQVFADWFLDMIIEWHNNDPVNQRELDRNQAAYNYQGNANPFIDHPEWVAQIWNPDPDTESPSAPTNLVVSNETSSGFILNWDASSDNVGVTGYDVYKDGAYVNTTSNTNYQYTGLSPLTSYDLYVKAKDAANNISDASVTVVGTTTDSGSPGTSTELFFTEYIEGSSNNKALEIGNFTDSTIDLTSYSIQKVSNGSGSWIDEYNLSGSLNPNDVFVIANGSAVADITNTADVTVGGSPLNFNGNDAIGLFKNGTLIDLIGNPNSSADFAKDVTLRRKAEITNPNTTFDLVGEWDSYPQDTFDGLGNHTLPVNSYQNLNFTIYPNPSNGIINIQGITNLDTIKIYNVQGVLVYSIINFNQNLSIDISTLNTGMYIVEIQTNNRLGTYKLLIK